VEAKAVWRFPTPEDEWRSYLDGSHYQIVWGRRLFRGIPWAPRCRVCLAPFGGPGGVVFRAVGIRRWEKNPNVCNHCIRALVRHEVMGADADISFLFADVRHSSELARQMDTLEFAKLMQRFYRVANDVLLDNAAILDKFVGDEAVGFFMPFMTGPDHAGTALRAARELLDATGNGGNANEPWITLGAGVNTGRTFVGMVSSGSGSEFTAFGDPINVAAHLAAIAGPGEILTTSATLDAASIDRHALERRPVSLKGHHVEAFVVPVSSGRPPASVSR
jgi:adenylate cyclase